MTLRSAATTLLLLALTSAAEAVTVTVGLAPSADATIFEENPDGSDAKGLSLFAGRTTTDRIRRAFLRFDLSGMPAGVTVSAAQVRLNLTRTNSGGVFASLYRVTAPWGEGTSDGGIPGGSGAAATPGDPTWTMRLYPGTPWTNPGGDTAPLPSATTLVADSLGIYDWTTTPELVGDVQGWLDAPATNFGWQLRVDEGQIAPTAKRFGSREDPSVGPVLMVTYDDPNLTEPAPLLIPTLDAGALVALAAALAVFGALALKR